MSATYRFCLDQATQSAKSAAEADLPNVKERCLRAEAAWRTMAARHERMDETRRQAVRDKEAASLAAE
jgi:hypothetical protein